MSATAAAAAERRAPSTIARTGMLVMVASGFAGLGYQVVWTQQAALWLGHEAAAVLAIVAAFFGGVALGAVVLGRRIARSAHPARWYAGCELAIAVWGLILAATMAPLADAMLAVIGPSPAPGWHWAVAFCGSFLVLLPATAAMGATLPAMARALEDDGIAGSRLARVYAANTAGAVFGVIATAFWLVPTLGLRDTARVCVLLNLLCAALVAGWPGRRPPMRTPVPATTRPLALLAATGLLGIGYEVLVVRVLSQVTENTVYTFALLLAVYLAGTALGAALWSRRRTAVTDPRSRDALLWAQAGTALLGMLALAGAPVLRESVRLALGGGYAAALASEAALALAAFGVTTVVMGALFSELAERARAAGHGVGTLLAWNTAGAAMAPPLIGVGLAAAIGLRGALLVVAAGYLVLGARSLRGRIVWLAPAAALIALVMPSLAFVDIPPGGRVVHHVDGTNATVSVVEDAAGVRTLRINNRQQEGSSATVPADARQALIPLLLHPAPQRALFLGLGTGITARAAADEPALEVDAVELLPEVVDASALFAEAFAPARHLRIVSADARRYVRTAAAHYDVVVADNFHPARSGSGALYTAEHFRAVRERLATGGLFCQWLPLHQLDLATLRSIVSTFLSVYPDATALLATHSLETPVLGLVGRADGGRVDPQAVDARLQATRAGRAASDFGLVDPLAVMGSFIAGPAALAGFAGDAPLNTDDRPVVAHRAPRITYAPDSLPRDRLMTLLGRLVVTPAELLTPSARDAWSARLSAYIAARHRFLDAGREVQPDPDVVRMLAQVQGPLVEVLRTSPEFRPAYDPLLRLAVAVAPRDPEAARGLLGELARLQPARAEAGELLRALPAAR